MRIPGDRGTRWRGDGAADRSERGDPAGGVVADPLGAWQAPVGREAGLPQRGQVRQPFAGAEIGRVVDGCLGPEGPCIRRVPCSMNTSTYRRLHSTVSTCRKSTARIPAAWVYRNCRQVRAERRGAGSTPAARRISQTVDGATAMPSFANSPWIRRWPHSGFSRARRGTSRLILGVAGGRPGLRRPLVSYFFAASLRCQAMSVAGVAGNISAQRRRDTIRASPANQARSAGSYRTRPACRRSTAFSCRSTSTSAAIARLPRNSTATRPSVRQAST